MGCGAACPCSAFWGSLLLRCVVPSGKGHMAGLSEHSTHASITWPLPRGYHVVTNVSASRQHGSPVKEPEPSSPPLRPSPLLSQFRTPASPLGSHWSDQEMMQPRGKGWGLGASRAGTQTRMGPCTSHLPPLRTGSDGHGPLLHPCYDPSTFHESSATTPLMRRLDPERLGNLPKASS